MVKARASIGVQRFCYAADHPPGFSATMMAWRGHFAWLSSRSHMASRWSGSRLSR